MPVTQPIDHPVLRSFCDDTLRPLGDLLAGLMPAIGTIIAAATGKGIPGLVGTDSAALFRPAEWLAADYAATGAPQPVVGADAGGRNARTHHDVIALLRAVAALKAMVDANPSFPALIAGWAVNPRPARGLGV